MLLRCVWFHAEEDDYGFIRVNRNKCICKEEPFILASQAHQIFYVEDPTKKDWYYVENISNDHLDSKECENSLKL